MCEIASGGRDYPLRGFPFEGWASWRFVLTFSFAAVPFEIECEDAVRRRGTSQRLGVPQRPDGVVISGAPMVLHRKTGKLVVFRVILVVLRAIDQLNDVVDLVAGDRL